MSNAIQQAAICPECKQPITLGETDVQVFLSNGGLMTAYKKSLTFQRNLFASLNKEVLRIYHYPTCPNNNDADTESRRRRLTQEYHKHRSSQSAPDNDYLPDSVLESDSPRPPDDTHPSKQRKISVSDVPPDGPNGIDWLPKPSEISWFSCHKKEILKALLFIIAIAALIVVGIFVGPILASALGLAAVS